MVAAPVAGTQVDGIGQLGARGNQFMGILDPFILLALAKGGFLSAMKLCGLLLCCHQSTVLIRLFLFPPRLLSQESCARVLLFRGASKEIRNYNSQTAFQVRQWAMGPSPSHRTPLAWAVAASDMPLGHAWDNIYWNKTIDSGRLFWHWNGREESDHLEHGKDYEGGILWWETKRVLLVLSCVVEVERRNYCSL